MDQEKVYDRISKAVMWWVLEEEKVH